MNHESPRLRQSGSGLGSKAVSAIGPALNRLLADHFALYVKTKNFHWHMSGTHFRDYHLLLDEHAAEILAAADPLAERCRKIGAKTLHSIGEIGRLQRIRDNDAAEVHPDAMLAELLADNETLVVAMRETHEICDAHNDLATASVIENWIDETENRIWFLQEVVLGSATRSN